jgi:oligopeptidase A
MLLVNTIEAAERARAVASVRRRRMTQSAAHPDACRASTRSARARDPAVDELLAERRRALEGRRAATCRPTTTRCPPCSTSPPSAWPRLGRRRPPERRGRHARAARAYNESLPQSPSSTPGSAPTSAVRQVQGDRASPAAAQLTAAPQALRNAMRDFVLSGAELQGAAKSASRRSRSAGRAGAEFSEHVLDATDGYRATTPPRRARRRAAT